MTDYSWTEKETELKASGFTRDMCFDIKDEAGAEYYEGQMQKRGYKTAWAEGFEPYAGWYLWVKR